MFHKYVIRQLTQISAWIGFALMLCALLHLSHFLFFLFGAALILTDDKKLQGLFAKWSPTIKRAMGDEA